MNLLDYPRTELSQFFQDLGEKPFRATQILKWVHQLGVTDFSLMTNLSKALRSYLQENTQIILPEIVTVHHSTDGTRKWLLRLTDGNCIEMVFIPEDDRGTLCVSSQVGCALNCQFCATAQQGFNRNLTIGEIVGQLWIAEHTLRAEGFRPEEHERAISNLVFMGMGEPLANFNPVVKAIQLMMDDFTYGLSWRRITVSTAGIIPNILRLKAQSPVHLAISLHAPTDELRNQLVPINKKYPIDKLIDACRQYLENETRRKVTFEYVMIDQFNDQPAHAKQLAKLLQGVAAKVNLIPFNPYPNSIYQRSAPEAIEEFRTILANSGLVTVTRKTRGDDIAAACGQLAGQITDRSRRGQTHRILLKPESYHHAPSPC